MKKTIFTGAGVAIVTPMNADGSINFDKLGELVEIIPLSIWFMQARQAYTEAIRKCLLVQMIRWIIL